MFKHKTLIGSLLALVLTAGVAWVAPGWSGAPDSPLARTLEAHGGLDRWDKQGRMTYELNGEIQLQLFYSYGSNPPLYPKWQEYMRTHQPPTLIVWGTNDFIFPAEGAHPYKRDLKNVEFHLLDTGHFALEEDCDAIATFIRRFVDSNVLANN